MNKTTNYHTNMNEKQDVWLSQKYTDASFRIDVDAVEAASSDILVSAFS